MAQGKGRKNIYDDYIKKVMYEVYANNKSPRKRDYEKAVAKLLGEGYTVDQVHSNVSRAIDRLVESGDMVDLGEHIFIPMSDEYKNNKAEKPIKEKIALTRDSILVISKNIFAVAVDEEQIKKESDIVRECFRNLMGSDKCYSVSVLNDVVIIMLNQPFEESGTNENVVNKENNEKKKGEKENTTGKKNKDAEYLQKVISEAYTFQCERKAKAEKDKLKAICRKQREFAKKQKEEEKQNSAQNP